MGRSHQLPVKSLLSAGDPRILLWDCSLAHPWADDFQELLGSGTHPRSDLRRFGGSVQTILTHCDSLRPHLLVLGIPSADASAGTQAVREMKARNLRCPILVITDAQHESELSDLFDAGASDFLPLPLRKWEVLARLAHWSGIACGDDSFPAGPVGEFGFEQIKGESPALQVQIGMARRFAGGDATVL